MNLNCKKPCKNCPFKVEGELKLGEGRVDEIARALLSDDEETFICHKTLFAERSRKSMCAGSMVFLLKAGAPNVAMRIGAAMGLLQYDSLEAQFDKVIDPTNLNLVPTQKEIRGKQQARSRLAERFDPLTIAALSRVGS